MTTQQILQGVHDWTNGKIVYDISVAHPDGQGKPTPYADLTAALGTGGANIPEPLRKGGMSVKFIQGNAQSSDNKYVQYRYMSSSTADADFTNTDNWQGVDEIPVDKSQNMAKSGGIEAAIKGIHNIITFTGLSQWAPLEIPTILNGTYIAEVITSAPAEVFVRTDANGQQGQQRIDSGNVTLTVAANYVVTSVVCDVEIRYGSIDKYLEIYDSKINTLKGRIDELKCVQTIITTNSWTVKAIQQIPSGTYISKVTPSTTAEVFVRTDSAGQQQQKVTNDMLLTIDANYLVTSTPCTVIIEYGLVDKLLAVQNASVNPATDKQDVNTIIKDIIIYDANFVDTDVYTVATLYKNSSVAQITISKNNTYVCSFYTESLSSLAYLTTIPEWNNSGIHAVALMDWSKVSSNIQATILNTKVNNKYSIIPSISNNQLQGKKFLAIGDSMTVGGQWATYVANRLGMTKSVHAKAGIGVIAMVDGKTGEFSPLSSSDVTDMDFILLMGLYNEEVNSINAPGTESDMYPTQDTFLGRVNYAVSRIYEELAEAGNTKCKVVLITAHKHGKNDWTDASAYTPATVQGVQTTRGEALFSGTKKAADYNSLYLIDLMHGGNINKYNWNEYQLSSTPYNQNYIPADGVNDGTNKPFASLDVAPVPTSNTGKYITVAGVANSYVSDGTSWNAWPVPYIWLGDQLHLNQKGYERIGEFIASHLLLI